MRIECNGKLAALAGAALGAAAFMIAERAEAQAGVATAQLEEIVVTARRREESVLEIPESITAFTALDIENRRIDSLRALVDLTPNVIVRETFRSNETFITMRGISTAQGGLPAASFIVDGVQLGGNEFINQDLFDIERIEVLRGPQGSLFGQGAIAGAVNIVTAAPTNELQGFVKASYGNEASARLAGSVSGPIVKDQWYFRLSGYTRDSDGFIENIRGEKIDGSDHSGLRARLEYEGENLDLSIRGSTSSGSGGAAMQDRPVLGGDGNPVAPDDVTNPGPGSNIIGREDTDFSDFSVRLDYDLGGATLTSISALADAQQDVYGDGDFLPVDIVFQDLTFTSDVFNQELRLTSDDDQRFRWLVGAFYQERDELANVFVAFSDNSPVNAGMTILNNSNQTTSDSWAAFGQLDYDLNDRTEFSLGLRHDEDEQTTVDQKNPGPTAAEASFSKLQPKLQLSHQWADEALVFASYSEGFRSGGFTQNARFEDEETANFEVGLKSRFADGSVTVNASLYRIDYINQQLSFVIFDEGVAQRGVLNLSDTDINGLEFGLSSTPADNLRVDIGVGYTDAVVKSADTSALEVLGITATVDGNRSPLVPELTANLALSWSQPLANGLELLWHADFRRRGDYFFDPFNEIATATNSFVNLNVRLDAPSWSVALWGRNVGDVRHATNISIGSSNRNRVQNRPRSFGLEATYRF